MTIRFSDNILQSWTCQVQALQVLSKLTSLPENPQISKCFLHIVSFLFVLIVEIVNVII